MHIDLDEAQRLVVHANLSDRRIVVAGPGAGKTATAVALVEDILRRTDADFDDNPKVLFVSFSSAAIAASVSAFGNGLDEVYEGVVAMTLDSLAWELTETTGDSFNERIDFDRVVELATTKMRLDYNGELDSLVHLIVDEAQDVTRVRRTFLLALIDRLNMDAGLTIFGDPLQSIYEFLDESVRSDQSAWETLVAGLQDRGVTSLLTLDGEYRAQGRGPRKVLAAARDMRHATDTDRTNLLDDLTTDLSHLTTVQFAHRATSWAGPTAVLVRTNAEVVALFDELAKLGLPCRANHSETRQIVVDPWVADLWPAVAGRPVSISAFTEFASNRDDVEEGWFRLFLHATHSGSTISWESIARLCSVGFDRTQPWFARDAGATVVSTIHQAKGLEWDNVAVADVQALLRPAGKREPESELLFVALSRARDKVVVLDWARAFYKTAPGSNLMYRPHPAFNYPTQVLITPGDLRIDDMIGGDSGQSRLRSLVSGERIEFDLLSSGSGWPSYRCTVGGDVVGATTPEFGVKFSKVLRGRGPGGWPQLGSVAMDGVESRWTTADGTRFWLQARPFGMADVLREGEM